MTIAKVADRGTNGQTTAGAASVAVAMAAGASVAVGNFLIARCAITNSGTAGAAVTLTVTDGKGNTWTVLGPANRTSAGAVNDGCTAFLCYAKVDVAYANADTITFHFSPNITSAFAFIVEEWSGIDADIPVAVAAATATGASATPSVSITPTVNGQLVYGCLAIEGGGADTYTEDTDTTAGSWVALTEVDAIGTNTTSNETVEGAYKLVTGPGAQTWNPAITSRDWAQVIAVFTPGAVVPADSANYVGVGMVKKVEGADTSNSTTYVTPAFAGRFLSTLLIWIMYGNDGQVPSSLTSISGTGIASPVLLAETTFNPTGASARSRLQLWVATANTTVDGITFTCPETCNGAIYFIGQLSSGVDNARGTAGVVNIGSGVGNAGSAYTENFSTTSPPVDGGTRQIVGSAHDAGVGITPQVFWTEESESILATPAGALEIQSVFGGGGTVSASPASGTADWALLSAEVAARLIDHHTKRARQVQGGFAQAVHRASRW